MHSDGTWSVETNGTLTSIALAASDPLEGFRVATGHKAIVEHVVIKKIKGFQRKAYQQLSQPASALTEDQTVALMQSEIMIPDTSNVVRR